MRPSEVAARAGVNPQTLRYYERRGLLPTPPRTPAGYRAYPAGTVRVIRFVKRAQELGFSLDEINRLLHLAHNGPAACHTVRALAQTKVAELDAKIADLRRMRRSLARLTDTCAQAHPDTECPLLDAIHTAN